MLGSTLSLYVIRRRLICRRIRLSVYAKGKDGKNCGTVLKFSK